MPDSSPGGSSLDAPNAMAIGVWNTILFEKFSRFREVLTRGFRSHGNAALDAADLEPGERVLDVGCGFGDTTRQIALAVGPDGQAVGLDSSPAFIARARADFADVPQMRFLVADAQTDALETGFDVVYSRFGTMFFDGPVAAMQNLGRALRPGGRLSMVVWRARRHSVLFELPASVVEALVPRPEDPDALTCGPGPFSLADPQTTRGILVKAGFIDVDLVRFDADIVCGRDLAEAVDMCLALGPAGETLRLAGEAAERARPRVEAALADALRTYLGPKGVSLQTSAWVVTARRPLSGG